MKNFEHKFTGSEGVKGMSGCWSLIVSRQFHNQVPDFGTVSNVDGNVALTCSRWVAVNIFENVLAL